MITDRIRDTGCSILIKTITNCKCLTREKTAEKIRKILDDDPSIINKPSDKGYTPLLIAIFNYKNIGDDIFKLLLSHNSINVNAVIKKDTILIHAINYAVDVADSFDNSAAEVVNILLEDKRVNVNATSSYGYTPLYILADLSDYNDLCEINTAESIISKLLQRDDIDVNYVTSGGSALKNAVYAPARNDCDLYKNKNVVEMLMKYGAEIGVDDDDGYDNVLEFAQEFVNNHPDDTKYVEMYEMLKMYAGYV